MIIHWMIENFWAPTKKILGNSRRKNSGGDQKNLIT
jgi:hypothetical protein